MLSDDSDNEAIDQITINEHFAKAYEYKKEREELAKLKEKYGSDAEEVTDDSTDSEEDESEDEEGEELTPAVDVAILRTLARIKRKDPSIYEQGKDVFEEERNKTREVHISSRTQKDKTKPLTMKQYALASVLNPASRSPSPAPAPLTHIEEQHALRSETIAAFHTAVSVDGEDEDDDLLIPREKTKDEIEQEEDEYRAYLQREVGTDLAALVTVEPGAQQIMWAEEKGEEEQDTQKDKKKEKGGKKERENDKKGKGKEKGKKNKEEDDHEFLMNYILNRGWIDRSAQRMPTYQEITAKPGKGKARMSQDDDEEVKNESEDETGGPDAALGELDDETFEEVADVFESSYNFRFEEPDAATIARHPRNLTSVVRRQDTTRKEAREKRKARKEEVLQRKREEVNRLKSLKMKDIQAKLELVGREGGKDVARSKALQELDLEGDWDPEAHDRQMAEIYEHEDGDVDEDKPQWDDDIDIGNIMVEEDEAGLSDQKKKKKKKKKVTVEEDGVDVDMMDADAVYVGGAEEWDGTEESRKAQVEAYMDEVYELDFNDMVGDMPTRFRYTKVPAQSYALTPVEILLATDAELNQYMGIKKYAPYRKEGQNWDRERGTKLRELKAILAARAAAKGEELPAEESEKPAKKRKGKKERMKEKAAVEGEEGAGETATKVGGKRSREDEAGEEQHNPEDQSKKKRRRHKKATEALVS